MVFYYLSKTYVPNHKYLFIFNLFINYTKKKFEHHYYELEDKFNFICENSEPSTEHSCLMNGCKTEFHSDADSLPAKLTGKEDPVL